MNEWCDNSRSCEYTVQAKKVCNSCHARKETKRKSMISHPIDLRPIDPVLARVIIRGHLLLRQKIRSFIGAHIGSLVLLTSPSPIHSFSSVDTFTQVPNSSTLFRNKQQRPTTSSIPLIQWRRPSYRIALPPITTLSPQQGEKSHHKKFVNK